jgi:hypothetical protein
MSINKTVYIQGRLDENCRVTEVNLTLSVMAISRRLKKFIYYRGSRLIEARITEVLQHFLVVAIHGLRTVKSKLKVYCTGIRSTIIIIF